MFDVKTAWAIVSGVLADCMESEEDVTDDEKEERKEACRIVNQFIKEKLKEEEHA